MTPQTLRGLRRDPAFTALATLAVAAAIGSTTVVFTLIDRAIWRPLTLSRPDSLVWLRTTKGDRPWPYFTSVEFEEYRRELGVEGFCIVTRNYQGEREAVHFMAGLVTPGFFETLDTAPAMGRSFSRDSYRDGANTEVLLSHSTWRRVFGADPHVVGRRIEMDAAYFDIVGVMPEGFSFPEKAEIWMPAPLGITTISNYELFLRSRPGLTVQQIDAKAKASGKRLAERDRELKSTPRAVTFLDEAAGSVRQTGWVLAAAVTLFLLIGCANAGGLTWARMEGRRHEMAVRVALGAGRRHLAAQVLSECTLLTLLGAAVGGAGAAASLPAIGRFFPVLGTAARWDVSVFLAATLVTGAVLIACSLPAAVGAVNSPQAALRGQSRGFAGKGAKSRRALVAVEVALSCILVANAGLLARSVRKLTEAGAGFDPKGVTTAFVVLGRHYGPQARNAYFERLIERIGRIPGVQAVGSVNTLPLSGFNSTIHFRLPGESERRYVGFRVIAPGYFEAMRVPLIAGRMLNEGDREGRPMVALVNREFASRYLPGGALGKMIIASTPDNSKTWEMTVAGVVGDIRQRGAGQPPEPEYYVSYLQIAPPGMVLTMRSKMEPAVVMKQVRAAMREIDPAIPAFDVKTMEDAVAESTALARLRAFVLSAFSVLALLSASLGIYSVASYTAERRRREIAIRLALGAARGSIFHLVSRGGAVASGLGLAAGLPVALASAFGLRALLPGVEHPDVWALTTTAASILAIALGASIVPAWRGSRVDPASSLRQGD